MRRILFAVLLAAASLDGHAQSLLPPCPTDTTVPWTNCFGTYTLPNGDKYAGEFRNSQKHGQGTYTYSNGEKIAGEFTNGALNGQGSYTFPTGRKYVGEFRDSQLQGEGILYRPNGSVEAAGYWTDGALSQSVAVDTARFPFNGLPTVAGNNLAEQARLAAEVEAARLRRLALQAQAGKAEQDRLAAELEEERRQTQEAEVRLAQSLARVPSTSAAARPSTQAVPDPNLRRVALVIGNARYTNAPVLTNPPSDAASVSAALREAGFQTVTVKTDLSQQATLIALREFASLADAADWAVVYYAGHGIEFGGNNYLIPVDARLQADRDIDLEGVDLGKVMAAVEGAKRLRLIILDACRDNPFANQMRRTMASRSLGRGLAKVEPEPGTLIAYAAKHGETAMDGSGTSNSPFAEALVKRIKQTPPLEIRRLFDYVRDDVLETTNNKQQPFSYGSVSAREDFFFTAPR